MNTTTLRRLLSQMKPEPFEGALEEEFQRSLDGPRRDLARMAAVLGILLFLCFGILDVWAIPSALGEVLAVRVFVATPMLLFLAWCSHRAFFIPLYRLFMFLMYGGMGLAIQAMILMAGPGDVARFAYYAGLILVVIALYNWTHLRTRDSALIGFGLVAIYSGLDLAGPLLGLRPPAPEESHAIVLGSNVFFFFAANLIGLLAAMQREIHVRELFLLRRQAESLAALKSAFLANMSHEIRTPLNGVLGMAQIGFRESLAPQTRQTFSRILESGKLLQTVLNDILDLSKIEAGKLDIEMLPTNPSRVIRDVTNTLMHAAQQKGLALTIDTAGLPPACLIDPTRLAQILLNLLSNAIKFTQAGSVHLLGQVEAGELTLSVRDTGIGIAPENLERLFEPFEQADTSTTRQFGGTGLGLTISRRLAELMGGRLTVSSAPGAGSTFELRLPLEEAALPALPDMAEAAETGQRLAGVRILVAEDQDINQLVLENLLMQEGAEVTLVGNGRLAVQAVESHPGRYDLVLMDVRMPEMDGLEATRTLRAKYPTLPIIGQTAHAQKEDHEDCLAHGMNATLTKPIDAELLVAAIRKHVPREFAVPPSPQAKTPGESKLVAPVVDWHALHQRFSGHTSFIDRLVTLGIQSHEDQPQRLRSLADAGDLASLEDLAHKLRNFAGNIVAPQLLDLSTQTMESARAGSPESVALARELADSLERVLRELKQRPSS